MEKETLCKYYPKKAEVAIRPDFRTRNIIRDKEGHYIMINRVHSTKRHKNPTCVCA